MRGTWTAKASSRGLAHLSTSVYAGGLSFRVRNETGRFPSPMAVQELSRSAREGGPVTRNRPDALLAAAVGPVGFGAHARLLDGV